MNLSYMKRIQSLALFLFIGFSSTVFSQTGRQPVRAENGMVVSSHYLASQVGTDILKQGGNAIDATVATAFALAVTLPSAGNIGGGGFIVYHGNNGKQTTFNFREKAPLAATRDMFLSPDGAIKDNSNHIGLLSVGVPGTVAGLFLAHQKLGKLPWATLLEPAINLAENGFPSTYDMNWFVEWVKANREEYATTAMAFLKDG